MFNGATKDLKPRSGKRSDIGDNSVTILTSGCHFTGKLYCSGATRIGGTIEGEVISNGILIVEEKAQICAKIKADEIVIQGEVEGKIEARTRLEICQSGRFSGDAISPVFVVREGAIFNGRSVMPQDDQVIGDSIVDKLDSVDVSPPHLDNLHKGSAEVKIP